MLTGENLTWQGCRELFRVGARSGAVLSSRLACGSRLKQQEALPGEEADHGAHAGGGLTYSLGLHAQVGVRGRCRWSPDCLGETAMQALCAGGKAARLCMSWPWAGADFLGWRLAARALAAGVGLSTLLASLSVIGPTKRRLKMGLTLDPNKIMIKR